MVQGTGSAPSPSPASVTSEHSLSSVPTSSGTQRLPSPTSPPHEIPLLPRKRPPNPSTRFTHTSSTPFPNSTGKEKKAGKTSASGEILKAFTSSSTSFSSLLEADMTAKGDRFRATMEHNHELFQFESEKVLYAREAEQAAAADRSQMVLHFGKMVEHLGKLAQKDKD
jgi:hypothetical protein